MRIFSTSTLILLFTFSLFAQDQSFWSDVSEAEMRLDSKSEQKIFPVKYRTLALDLEGMKKILANAPMEYTSEAKTNAVKLDMPLPDGSFETFEIWETVIMQPKLAAKYPHLKAFTGRNRETGSIIALDYGSDGFHGSIMTLDATYYIDPYATNQDQLYMSYNVKDDLENWGSLEKLACGYNPDAAVNDYANGTAGSKKVASRVAGELQELKTFILALACTGEFAQSRGGTKMSVMTQFNTVVSRINQIYQVEVAVKMVLHENNDVLIFTEPGLDPYPIADVGGELLGINNNVVNGRIPVGSYDIGHVMTNRCTDVGGVASGTNACQNGRKAGGVTCNGSFGLNISTMAHEMGHQNSVSHSWDNCPGNDGQRASGGAFEPGSGTTIMSYSGACGSQNIGADDDYYSNGSLQQFISYTHNQVATCGTVTTPGNTKPEIHWEYENGFAIPTSTPFELIGDATDEDGDVLTYCWEQHDLRSSPTLIGLPAENCPMWRSYPASMNKTRTFPLMPYVLNPNQPNIPVIERSADYGREFNFTLTVRDNNPEAGGTVWEQVQFDVDGGAGPFLVTSQSDPSTTWTVGEEVDITWDVAGTNEAPVNCSAVDIYLSDEGGNSFEYLLTSATPNDGHAKVFVPNVVTDRARLKVKGHNNIFFNVNDTNFDIVETTVPGFTADVIPTYHYACLPNNTKIEINTGSILNYSEELNIEILTPIPSGMTASLDKSKVTPGESATLDLSMVNDLGSGSTALDIIIYGNGTDTVTRQLILEYFRNDFSAIAMTGPLNGVAGVDESPTLTWNTSPDAQTFDLQIAISPAFGPDDLIEEAFGLTDTFFNLTDLLEENTPYYWRIRPANQCGAGEYLTPSSFHTISKQCQRLVGLEGDNQKIPIPGSGLPRITSSVSILTPGVINDVNVPNIKGSYEPLTSIKISLMSPDSTEVVLFRERCSGSVFNFGFDDAIANRNPCPANNGRVRGSDEPLSRFNGKELVGSWTVAVEVVQPGVGGGGNLEEWTLEFCADLALEAPSMIINDTLPVSFGLGTKVGSDYLETVDDVDQPWGITYTLVTLPEYGKLVLGSEDLKIGDQFTQKMINDGRIWYEHDGVSTEEHDNFTFTIRDTEGGWLATPQFNFKLDLATVSADDIDPGLEENITLFPNPANDILNIQIDRLVNEKVYVKIFNAQGKLMKDEEIQNPDSILRMDISKLTDGYYFVTFITDKGRATKALVIENQ